MPYLETLTPTQGFIIMTSVPSGLPESSLEYREASNFMKLDGILATLQSSVSSPSGDTNEVLTALDGGTF